MKYLLFKLFRNYVVKDYFGLVGVVVIIDFDGDD